VTVRESLSHEQAAELLPWLINDSLEPDERARVFEHAKACVICRRDMDDLEQIRRRIATTAGPIPSPDMRRINARIDALTDRRERLRRLLAELRDIASSPWNIAFATQSVLLVILAGVVILPGTEEGGFSTLTDAEPLGAGNYVRVVFDPELGDTEIGNFLDRFELTVVDGPSRRGVYTLGVSDSLTASDRDDLLSFLQRDARILFAQPVARWSE
jgi:hypothetical protein